MQLVHVADGSTRVLAADVEVADSIVTKGLGLMFRRSLPEEYALAFPFASVGTRSIHMLCVFVPLDVIWASDGVVTRVERLRPWLGFARAEADLVVELPAGAATDVEPGDRVRLDAD